MSISQAPTNVQVTHRNHYAQFKVYLQRNIKFVKHSVEANAYQLSDEVRTQALHTLSYALGEDDLWPQVRNLLLALAPKMELAGHREDWLPYLEKSLEESKRVGDMLVAAECELQIGLIYRLIAHFQRARKHFGRSIEIATAADERRAKARALNELAWLEQVEGHYDIATAHVKEALQLLGRGDPERAICYRVQGMIAFGRENWQEAEQLHRMAFDQFYGQGDQRRSAWSLQNLAFTLNAQQRYDEAIDLYKQAAHILEEIGDSYHLAVVLTNWGLTHYDFGSTAKAISCYQRAEDIANLLEDKLLLARLFTNYGLAYLKLQQFTEAQSAFHTSAHLFKQLHIPHMSLNATDGLIIAHLRAQEHDKAIELATEAIASLHEIQRAPNYDYLYNSLQQHLIEARKGKHENDSTNRPN